jgi:predicted enzyme related to lactoylglutathione lyase
MSTEARGRFVWHDLMTTDQEKAIDFYTKVVGWTTQDWEGSPTRYPMWLTPDGAMIGGSVALQAEQVKSGVPQHWLGYIATPNVDETIAAATKLGGNALVPPLDIPTVGRSAVLADPQGAVFGIFTPEGKAPGHEGAANVGECSWHELYSSDYEAGLSFYTQLFGWEKTNAYDMGPMGTYQIFARNGQDLGGMMNKPDASMPSAWTYYFRVPDINEGAQRVTANGGKILNGPMEVPGGDMIVLASDPQGGMFALHQVKG